MKTTLSCLISLLLAGMAQGHGTHDHGDQSVPMVASRSTERIVLPDIPVTDQTGHRKGFVSRYSPAGPVIISFLYTDCVEACAMTRAVLGIVDQDLALPGAPAARIITITVDPLRDTPEVLAQTAREQGASDRWDWLAADAADTPVLLGAFGLTPGPIEAHESVYLIGDLRSGSFTRVEGVPEPEALIALVRAAE